MIKDLDPSDYWEALFDKKYLRWFHLMGKEVTVEIVKVEKCVEVTVKGGATKKTGIVHFKGKDKPLVLNQTNAAQIAELHGWKPSGWVGKRITLYQSETKLKGVPTPCIRVKAAA